MTDLSELEKVNAPLTVPLCLPKTRTLDAVMVVRSTGTSNVMVTVAFLEAIDKRAGLRFAESTAIAHAVGDANRMSTGVIIISARSARASFMASSYGPLRVANTQSVRSPEPAEQFGQLRNV